MKLTKGIVVITGLFYMVYEFIMWYGASWGGDDFEIRLYGYSLLYTLIAILAFLIKDFVYPWILVLLESVYFAITASRYVSQLFGFLLVFAFIINIVNLYNYYRIKTNKNSFKLSKNQAWVLIPQFIALLFSLWVMLNFIMWVGWDIEILISIVPFVLVVSSIVIYWKKGWVIQIMVINILIIIAVSDIFISIGTIIIPIVFLPYLGAVTYGLYRHYNYKKLNTP